MQRTTTVLILAVALMLAACNNFTPREKAARVDATTGTLELPYPCPDWSQTQTYNYRNERHSNYGCAVNTNAALQLEDPNDLQRGHGEPGPDAATTTRVIERYRAGEIPTPLVPLQTSETGGTAQ